MGLTLENTLPLPYRIVANKKEVRYKATFDSSYEEFGESFKPADVNLSSFESVSCTVLNSTEAEATPVSGARYSASKATIQLIDGKTAKELAKEKDCSKVEVAVMARGN